MTILRFPLVRRDAGFLADRPLRCIEGMLIEFRERHRRLQEERTRLAAHLEHLRSLTRRMKHGRDLLKRSRGRIGRARRSLARCHPDL